MKVKFCFLVFSSLVMGQSAFANEMKVNIGKYTGKDLNGVVCNVEIKAVKFCSWANEKCIVIKTSLGTEAPKLFDQFVDIETNPEDDARVESKINKFSSLIQVEYSGVSGFGPITSYGSAVRLGVSSKGKPIYMSYGQRHASGTYKNVCILK